MRATACVIGALAASCGRVSFDLADAPIEPACANALLCDDFERGDLSRWSGTDLTMPGTLAVSPQRPRASTYALDATTLPSTFSGRAAARVDFSAQPTGVIAVRLWLNLPQPLINYDHIIGIYRAGGGYLLAGGDFGSNWVASISDGISPVVDHLSTTPVPPLDTWTCVEFLYDLDLDRIKLFVNDAPIIDAPGLPAPAWDAVLVGIVRSEPVGMHVFVDDVVVARARIGC